MGPARGQRQTSDARVDDELALSPVDVVAARVDIAALVADRSLRLAQLFGSQYRYQPGAALLVVSVRCNVEEPSFCWVGLDAGRRGRPGWRLASASTETQCGREEDVVHAFRYCKHRPMSGALEYGLW
jgi:hypothetical protein